MSIIETIDNLPEVHKSLFRRKLSVDQKIEKLAALDVFVDIVNAHNGGMVHELHHDNFAVNPGPRAYSVGVGWKVKGSRAPGGCLFLSQRVPRGASYLTGGADIEHIR